MVGSARPRGVVSRGAALWALATLGGCAAAAPRGPVVSPTGIVYELGTPPTETRSSQTAMLYLRQERPDRALELLLEGIADAPGNPIHYYLAGVALARMGEYLRADSMFTRAQDIYPAYELDIEPEREAAWGLGFNAGLEAYQDGDVERAIELWTGATTLYALRPEAHRNLASLLTNEGKYSEAIDVYEAALLGLERFPATRLLDDAEIQGRAVARAEIEAAMTQLLLLTNRFAEAEPLLRRQLSLDPDDVDLRADLAAALTALGREAEAREIYETLLSEAGLAATQIYSLGVGLFRVGQFDRASEAFGRLAEILPNSRDAWFNYVNALFAAEAWEELESAARRLVDLDPLGETARLIAARAHLESGDRVRALESLQAVDSLPVVIDGLRMQRSGNSTLVRGRVLPKAAAPGTPVRVMFTFFDDVGALVGTETIVLRAPGASEPERELEVRFGRAAASYRYEAP